MNNQPDMLMTDRGPNMSMKSKLIKNIQYQQPTRYVYDRTRGPNMSMKSNRLTRYYDTQTRTYKKTTNAHYRQNFTRAYVNI